MNVYMQFPITQVRAQFPSLAQMDKGKPRVYLDNPAGTQVPEQVVKAVSKYYLHSNANRGGHFCTSIATEHVVTQAHLAMSDLFGTDDPGEVIIGASSTSINFHISRSICRNFAPGDEIVLTKMDHDANVAPWLEIAEDIGLVIKWVEFSCDSWTIEPEALKAVLNSRTRLVALNYASNVTGAVNDIKRLVDESKAVGALTYIDAVQFAPHCTINVADIGCDFLVCSPYKFFGPHLGVLWGRRELLESLHAYKVRCVGNSIPTKFEVGTPAVELLAGLIESINYMSSLSSKTNRRERLIESFSMAENYENILTKKLLDGLMKMENVEIIGPSLRHSSVQRLPTVSFRHKRIPSIHFAKYLANENIFIWSGHHYALGILSQLGIPKEEGVVRIGLAHYNTIEEVDLTLAALRSAEKTF